MIYICLPVYNEERTVGVVLWKIRQVMAEFERDYQVLVVDDASTDGTGAVMEPYARIMPVHVRRQARRQGYAASLEALLREAVSRSAYPKRDVVVTIQGDFTDEPDDIATLVKRIEGGADVVTGNVRLVAGDAPRMLRWSRGLWRRLLRGVRAGAPESDPLSGFRAYRISALRRALDDAGRGPLLTAGDGWAANVELLRRVLPHSRRTEAAEVRVRYGRLQRPSRFRPVSASLALLRQLRDRPARAPIPAEAATASGLRAGEEAVGAGTGGGGRSGGGRRGRGGRRGNGARQSGSRGGG